MAEVYRATDTVLERTVAVKVLAERYALDDEVRARFEREALAAARLSGTRHVITIFDVGQHRGRPLIVMEFLDGGSVHDRLAEGRVELDRALEWLGQTAHALDKAHAQGIVHRDVKPANLLLDREGAVHVSDFGIASAAGLDPLTLPGTVLGTAGYLAPEQARGEPATPASDRYGLGVVAFELLTGRRPYAADTPVTEAFAHVTAAVPSATRVAPELPSDVDRALSRALAKEPEARPDSCGALVAELREALTPVPTAVLAPAPDAVRPSIATAVQTAPVRRTPRRGGPRLSPPRALGIALVVLVGIVVASLLGASGNDGASRTVASRGGDVHRTSAAAARPRSEVKGSALNDAGYARMQVGDYEGAIGLLREAVWTLRGTGAIEEAWADYNLAFTRFALGRCDGVLGLLDRSQRIQGHRPQIDELRREWETRCAEPAPTGEDGHGKGKGKGRGRGKGEE